MPRKKTMNRWRSRRTPDDTSVNSCSGESRSHNANPQHSASDPSEADSSSVNVNGPPTRSGQTEAPRKSGHNWEEGSYSMESVENVEPVDGALSGNVYMKADNTGVHIHTGEVENLQIGEINTIVQEPDKTPVNTGNSREKLDCYGKPKTAYDRSEEWPALGKAPDKDIVRSRTYAAATGLTEQKKKQSSSIQVNVFQQGNKTDTKINKTVEFDSFRKQVGEFKQGNFILVTGKIERDPTFGKIGSVPWTAVFDFDVNSRSSGLLSVVEDVLKDRRSLSINTWQDKCSFTDQSTHWIQLLGSNEKPDTRTPQHFRAWWKHVQHDIESQMMQLAKFAEMYTNYKIIVVWPQNQEIGQHIHTLLTKLDDKISSGIDVILLDEGQTRSEGEDSALRLIKGALDNALTTAKLTMSEMCSVISSCFEEDVSTSRAGFEVPVNRTSNCEITRSQAMWLKEDLEVLYFTSQYNTDTDMSDADLKRECDTFFRGGTLPWCVWYEIEGGHVDVRRDIMDSMINNIKRDHVNSYKSGVVRLCHAPGSGGTTLAQRILWELRKVTPCAQVKLRTGSTVQDLAQKVSFLYDKTGMPILLLMDGEDEQRINLLTNEMEDTICFIILYVTRYPYPMEDKASHSRGRYWLKKHVSEKEAKCFALKFAQQCDDERKRKAIQRLSESVRSENERHSVFEFGLAAYRYEYKGIESYVRGFLMLEKNDSRDLQPWQKALCILSLVYYYGQSAVPCQFFAAMLDRQTLTNIGSFPDTMQELIVPDEGDGRYNVVRISHYYVAKEILEQLLPWPLQGRQERSDFLCTEAKKKLEPFATYFIRTAGEQVRRSVSSNHIVRIMTRTFISRDNKPVGEGETHVKGKQKLSPILEDLDPRSPYTERFQVIKNLTVSFPREAQYFAHLGRLYTIYKPKEEKEAEKCFNTALSMCEAETEGKQLKEYSKSLRLTLMYVNHMFGMMYLRRISEFTGRSLGELPRQKIQEDQASDVAQSLLEHVRIACKYFGRCREVTPPRHEETYGYIGEITVRLQLCEFLLRHFGPPDSDIYQFMDDPNSPPLLSAFVKESLVEIDDLFIECFSEIQPEKLDDSVARCGEWFAALFKKSSPGPFTLRNDHCIAARRMQIAEMKLRYSKEQFGVLEHVTKREDLLSIIQKMEDNFEALYDRGETYSKRALDLDYREWLAGIRHRLMNKTYSLEHVHRQVQKWNEEIRTPYSQFYLFTIKSLMGFGSSAVPGNTQLLIEAQKVKEDLLKQTRFVQKPRYPREWLGTETDIKQLAQLARFPGREVQNGKSLALMKGTIRGPNDKPAAGYIDLDLGEYNRVSVNVFFVPSRCEPQLKGVAYANTRVEFYLGFSLSHGYEAFHVLSLRRVKCSACGLPNEITSQTFSVRCQCGSETSVKKASRE